MCARIGEFLDQNFRVLPREVVAWFAARGATVSAHQCLKISFHATFFVELDPPLREDGDTLATVIVQILGCQLSDKALFGQLGAANLVKAAEVASQAGVRVPKVYGSGTCASRLGPLDFVVEEFVETDTVEDSVRAPQEQWCRIADEVKSSLDGYDLGDVDVSPLPHFDSLSTFLQWLMVLTPIWDAKLVGALALFVEGIIVPAHAARKARLIHQDVNGGNLLCSPAGHGSLWKLDALIDWESAAVMDPRLLTSDDPWQTARMFALVVKGVNLASRFVAGTLPRCELLQLVEKYDRAARCLDVSGWVPYEPWSARVKKARDMAHSGAAS